MSKLTDADGENAETDTWIDFARNSEYLNKETHRKLSEQCAEVGKMLGSMLNNPKPFLLTAEL